MMEERIVTRNKRGAKTSIAKVPALVCIYAIDVKMARKGVSNKYEKK